MTTALATTDDQFAIVEQVMISGDLAKLTPPQRVQYYNRVCESLGLNPYTKPFSYITLNGKLTLYALKDAAEQLRSKHGISITKLDSQVMEDLYIVIATALTKDGRTDQSTGAVSIGNLKGEAKANAIMKAETKAKRRVTLSIAGLGWLDESEVDSIPGAQRVYVDTSTGEIMDGKPTTNGHTEPPTFDTGDKCAECNAPHGRPHATTCSHCNGNGKPPQRTVGVALPPDKGEKDENNHLQPVDDDEVGFYPADKPADTPTPDEALRINALEIIDAANMKTPSHAQEWAVKNGYRTNEHSARTEWAQMVNEQFAGKLTMPKMREALVAYIELCLIGGKKELEAA